MLPAILDQLIYGVFDRRTDEPIYKGSTEVELWLRWGRHLCSAFRKGECERALYRYMFEQGFQHFEPRVIEELSGLTKDELRAREQVHLDHGGMPRCNMKRAIDANPKKRETARKYYRKNMHRWKVYHERRKLKNSS